MSVGPQPTPTPTTTPESPPPSPNAEVDFSKMDVTSLIGKLKELEEADEQMKKEQPETAEIISPIFDKPLESLREVVKKIDELQKNKGDVNAYVESIKNDPTSDLMKSLARLQILANLLQVGLVAGKDVKSILDEFLAQEAKELTK